MAQNQIVTNVSPDRILEIQDDSAPAGQTDMMKAIVQRQYGAPQAVLALQAIAKPIVKAGEALVRVHATSVHVGHWMLVRGVP